MTILLWSLTQYLCMISKTVTDSFPGTEKKINAEKKVRVQCATNKSFWPESEKNVLSTVLFLNTIVSKSCNYTTEIVLSGKEPMFFALEGQN